MAAPLPVDKDYKLSVLLHQARDAVHKARDKELSQYGISPMDAAALFAIHAIGDKATPAEISRWIFREHQTVTALLGRMEMKGLITRTRDLDMKNMWRVTITEKGYVAYRQSTDRESIHMALSLLSENEKRGLESYLRKVRDQALKYSIDQPPLPFP